MLKRFSLVVLVAVVYWLHQDSWNWREPRPLVFGFLPFGLFYHALYTLAASALLWLLCRVAWPGHLDSGEDPRA
ncbi:MAG: DUF3311 domain-containing protein [Acidobacteria bacterium]|nr:DUF3311 domain-containing protein [Acidobacteriota bacterium]